MSLYNKSKEDEPTYFNTLGTALFRSGEFEEAIDPLKKSLERTEERLQVYDLYILAGCYVELGDIRKAIELHQEAEEKYGKFRDSYPVLTVREIETFRQEIGTLIRIARKRIETDEE